MKAFGNAPPGSLPGGTEIEQHAKRVAQPLCSNDKPAASMAAATILQHLDKVRPTGPGKWLACCPAHDDKSPSLSVRETDDGTVLLKCFAGCNASEIVESIGLSLSDLFPLRLPPGTHSHRSKAPRVSWREVFDAIETELLTIAIAWSDFANGVPLSDDDALYLSRRANHLAELISEVRNGS